VVEVLFVGTGDAFGSGGRRNSAIVVRANGSTLLLDCGPTTLGGLKQLGVNPREVDAIAISHFHGDHTAGVPFLMLDELYENPRKGPLTVLGPPGIESRITSLCRDYSYSADEERPYNVRFEEFSNTTEREVAGFRIRTHPAHHHPETLPHMFGVGAGNVSLFFTGDTGWHEELPDRVGEVDLLISECVFYEPRFEHHLSHVELERTRDRFRCKRIVLTHLGSEILADRDAVRFETVDDGTLIRL
jgi:ribonuclease BN (tRNA processing enzyme)